MNLLCLSGYLGHLFFFHQHFVVFSKHIYIFCFLLTTGHKVSVLTCILEKKKKGTEIQVRKHALQINGVARIRWGQTPLSLTALCFLGAMSE